MMNATTTQLRQISRKDFASFGLDHVAYVKAVEVDGEPGWAVHAADGTPLTVLPERDLAYATVRQHDMEPVSVH